MNRFENINNYRQMKTYKIKTITKTILADTITPVNIYLKMRDIFPNALLLESSDYQSNQNSFSFICLKPVATFMIEDHMIYESFPDGQKSETLIDHNNNAADKLYDFINLFQLKEKKEKVKIDGIFGYTSYDGVKYFEDIELNASVYQSQKIPEIRYSFYKYIIAINHYRNELYIIDNIINDEQDEEEFNKIESLLFNRNFATYKFKPLHEETSNLTDDEYMEMVTKGKEHCHRGDVFQIVLSRQFSQKYNGDDFNVYRALRSINPSPYLFYFDYGDYKIFGSSPETQIEVANNKAFINPIAGTFKRTGNDQKDQQLAEELTRDEKENSEHIMLVDLARNDLNRTTKNVRVEKYREIQFYSHVIHMVSKVAGDLEKNTNSIKIMADSFPAGTLSGAPKYKAMQLIDLYENKARGYYGGCIGYIRLNGDINQAIMIRSFMSKDNALYYQAGAGIVADSKEKSELQEVNNKLMALKHAINMAQNI
ncbi:MAG: anthranilate synthase component I family protein [Bacteroidota bacterium]